MNTNLIQAKKARNDEFYTLYEDIEREIAAYVEYDSDVFRNKTVLLPCDDPERSNFTKYFLDHFDKYGIRKLVSTCISQEKRVDMPLFCGGGRRGKFMTRRRGYEPVCELLSGDGDFRSKELCRLRDEADIIITNPPFSLFREFIKWILEASSTKKFLIIGNMNTITYKEIFPLIKENKMWLGNGFQAGNAYFRIPEENTKEYVKGVLDDNTRIVKFRNCCWFTNLEHGRRHEPLKLHTMEWNLKNSKHKEIRDV